MRRCASWSTIGGAEGEVAEFSAGAGGFAVEVEVGVGDHEDFGGVGRVADEVEHGGGADGEG